MDLYHETDDALAQAFSHVTQGLDSGLSEITNQLPMASKRQVATTRTARPSEMTTSDLERSQDSPAGPKESALLSRWYQLVGEMQCVMAQMQQLGMSPPTPFAFQAPQSQPISATPSPTTQVPRPIPRPVAQPREPAQPRETTPSGPWNDDRGRSSPAEAEYTAPSRKSSKDMDTTPFVALVEFKRQRIRRYDATLFVKPGEYVVVDGDRGTDCGFVVQCAVRNPDGTFGLTESIDNTPLDFFRIKTEPGRIHRVATEQEVNLLHGEIASMERFALKTCRDRVSQMGLKMEIVDCEFQFDRKKVTFFFDSQESIDFRELTKDLYRVFGARIWLENINTKVKNVVPDGALSHADKLMYAQRGLRVQRR